MKERDEVSCMGVGHLKSKGLSFVFGFRKERAETKKRERRIVLPWACSMDFHLGFQSSITSCIRAHFLLYQMKILSRMTTIFILIEKHVPFACLCESAIILTGMSMDSLIIPC